MAAESLPPLSDITDELEHVEIFADVDRNSLLEITPLCRKRYLGPGDTLICENDTGRPHLYILCRGDVEIVSNRTLITSGEVVLSKRDRELFGEIGWLAASVRTATVRCIGDVEAIEIDGDGLMMYLEQNPRAGFLIMRRVAKMLAQRFKGTNDLLKLMLWNAKV